MTDIGFMEMEAEVVGWSTRRGEDSQRKSSRTLHGSGDGEWVTLEFLFIIVLFSYFILVGRGR